MCSCVLIIKMRIGRKFRKQKVSDEKRKNDSDVFRIIFSKRNCLLVSFLNIFHCKKWAILSLFFFIFVFSTVNSKHADNKISPMTGFKLRTSGIGSHRSAYWTTTTVNIFRFVYRTETVSLLLEAHPELVGPYTAYGGAMYCHTPLHLASRNGHKWVKR